MRWNSNFATLFKHLFGGGDANLVLVESDDPLEAGLEIMCQPPGKKLSTLSLLSGGEQTLTALSLIFAVFLANPSPICVLDEVDAPLDDANVTRFCDLLDEMTRRTDTRFLIITHHAVTMARMDRLFGVTMAELGVSQLVSVDLTPSRADGRLTFKLCLDRGCGMDSKRVSRKGATRFLQPKPLLMSQTNTWDVVVAGVELCSNVFLARIAQKSAGVGVGKGASAAPCGSVETQYSG